MTNIININLLNERSIFTVNGTSEEGSPQCPQWNPECIAPFTLKDYFLHFVDKAPLYSRAIPLSPYAKHTLG